MRDWRAGSAEEKNESSKVPRQERGATGLRVLSRVTFHISVYLLTITTTMTFEGCKQYCSDILKETALCFSQF